MCILLGIGIRTIFQNSELLNLANFCEKSWHTPLRYMVCAAIANVSYSFQHRSFKLCRMFVYIMKMCISQNDTRQEIWYVGPTGSVGYTCTIFCLISYMYVLYTNLCGDSLMNHGNLLLEEEYWRFRYGVFYNASITSIAEWRILELPVLCALQY